MKVGLTTFFNIGNSNPTPLIDFIVALENALKKNL